MKKIFFTLLTLIMLNPASWAILDEKKIDIREAIERALQTNPQIQMKNMDIVIAQKQTSVSNRLQNPSIDTHYNIGDAAKGDNQLLGATYYVEVLKRGKRKAYAKSKEEIAFNDSQFSKYDLILDVRKAYIDVLHKKSILNVLREQKKLAKELYESLKSDAAKGKIPETEVLQAKIALSRTIMAEKNAKYGVVFSQNRFNTVMNTASINYDTKEEKLNGNYNDLLTIDPTNDKLEFDKIKAFALSNRYDLKKAKQEVVAAEKNLDVIKSKLLPDVELSGGYAWATASDSGLGRRLNGAYASANIVNIPLFYRYKPEIENAQLEIAKAELNYKDIEIDAIRNISDAWERYVITRENLNFYNKELLANSKELLSISIKNLNARKIDFTTFLVSKKIYFDLILDYQQALADYYNSYAELVKEMNIIEVEKETDFI